ncbi:hypothetical protein CRUP_010526 [Coryphaenoides rupestris]|nr:hypothetical protein CRUP_010526 [Coryphaenoides rupestris]
MTSGDPKLGNTDGFNLLSRGGGGGRGEERMSTPRVHLQPPSTPRVHLQPPSTPRVHLQPPRTPGTPRVHLQPPSTPGYTCRHPAPPGSTCSPPAPPGPPAAPQHPRVHLQPPSTPRVHLRPPSTPPGPPAGPQHPRVHLRPPSTPGSNCSPPAPCGATGQRCSRGKWSSSPLPRLFLPLLLLLLPVGVQSTRSLWHLQRVPAVLPLQTAARPNPHFLAPPQLEVNSSCDPACHRAAPRPTYRDLQQLLAFQTLHSNGRLTETAVGIYLAPPPPAPPSARQEAPPPAPVRRKRQIFGHDGRFSIAGRDHLLLYPFSTAVKLSTGCSGTLVGERHVLTAAHCVHDGRSYVKEPRSCASAS